MNEELDTSKTRAVVQLLDRLAEFNLSPQVVDALAGINYMRIYRWLGQAQLKFFRLNENDMKRVLAFCEAVDQVKASWLDVVTSWDRKYHRAVRVALYRPAVLHVLAGKMSYDEKVHTLVKQTMVAWAKDKAKKGER